MMNTEWKKSNRCNGGGDCVVVRVNHGVQQISDTKVDHEKVVDVPDLDNFLSFVTKQNW